MRKLILQLAISLDGLIEGPNGEFDWCFTDQDYGMNEFLDQTDAIFFGRKSYDLFTEYIPAENAPSVEKAFWNRFLHMKKYVFSRSPAPGNNDVIYISDNISERVKELKQQAGKNIWLYGGASLTTALMNANLVDGLILAMHPVILGHGTPLFKDLDRRTKLVLKRSVPYDTGLISLHYDIL